jgi:hypothetical protein
VLRIQIDKNQGCKLWDVLSSPSVDFARPVVNKWYAESESADVAVLTASLKQSAGKFWGAEI